MPFVVTNVVCVLHVHTVSIYSHRMDATVWYERALLDRHCVYR